LAWLVTIAFLGYLFSTVSVPQVLRALKDDARAWTVPVMVALVFVVYLADSVAIWKTFGWFVARLSFREVLVVRGATYLLALINFALGQGAIVYFVYRSRGVPLLRGAAAVLLVVGIDVLTLLMLASLGLAMAAEIPPALKILVAVGYGIFGLYIVLVVVKPRWLTSRPLFDVLLTAGLSGHVKALVVRLPHVSSLVLFSYASLRAFGVAVPLAQAVLYLPVIYFIAVLPISVQGLGTSQAAMVFFFAQYAPIDRAAAVVLASSLTGQAIMFAVQLLLGLVCLKSQLARNLQPPQQQRQQQHQA
jgi:hypothetical protein